MFFCFFISTEVDGASMAGATWNCCRLRLGASSVYTIQPCSIYMSLKVYASLAVTCHLHFWQNDLDFLRATAVTRGWNGYRNKSQHRKSTLEKKILPPLLQGLEPATFQSRVRRSNYWAIPAPSLTPCRLSVRSVKTINKGMEEGVIRGGNCEERGDLVWPIGKALGW